MKYFCSSLIFIFLFPFVLFAQRECDCHERLSKLAWYYYTQSQFKEGLSAMREAVSFQKGNATRTDYVILAFLYEKTDSLDQAANALLDAVSRGLSLEDISSENYTDIKNSLGNSRWEYIMGQFDAYNQKYKSSLDLDYRLAIEWLKGSDQRIRTVRKSLRAEDYILFDSLNFTELKNLIEKYGFPSIEKHGFDWGAIDAFFMHYSIESTAKFHDVLQIMENASSECLLDRSFITVIMDRYRRRTGTLPQQFGEWNLWQEEGYYGPIEEMQAVDNRRFKYNLLRLLEQSKIQHRELPADYNPANYPTNYFCGYIFE